ncbi:YihY/virulence factor BrkB family protein [Halomonas sp. Bachu 37]|uniref:YihY/virulence factor BrkB family protein n=1 Tax=Halomonas kashgarensis TaxID=3084920 RepID=UPI0032172597
MHNKKRGRRAEGPEDIPSPGWLDIVWRVKRELEYDRVTLLAAGVAFYALLALFPAIAAVIALWAVLLDPADISQQMQEVSRFIPPGAASLINEQTRKVVENTEAGLSITAIGSTLVAMFVASKGVRGLMVGLNAVYGEEEKRGIVMRNLMVAALTLGLIVMTLVSIAFVAILPLAIELVGMASPYDMIIGWLRWPALLVVMSLVIAMLYRFAPYRRAPRWEWISIGTMLATFLWLLGSGGLSLYVRYVSNFSELYGSLGAVVVLMLWFWLSAFAVLMGAEINGEMERQTCRDSTVGKERPMGERGAYAADTVGNKHPSFRKKGKHGNHH